jgi:putative SOS response-associated peptidase YedK
MCRAYIDLTTREAIAALKDFLKRIGDDPNDLDAYDTIKAEKPWSIRTTDMARVIGLSKDGSRWGVQLMRWGLVPSFAGDIGIGNRMVNARSETIATLPAYKHAFEKRRCVVPATSWVEWREEQPPGANRPFKQPYRIQRADGAPILFAGLWERNSKVLPGQDLLSYTIATCEPTPGSYARHIHDRTPVLIDPESAEAWCTASPDDAQALLRPYAGPLIAHPIHRDFSNWKTATPESIEPIGPPLAQAA